MGKLLSFDCPDKMLKFVTDRVGIDWASKSDGIRVLMRIGIKVLKKENKEDE